jgi:hypothetical protein
MSPTMISLPQAVELESRPYLALHGEGQSVLFPKVQTLPDRYLAESEIYHLKGGFEAEVIHNPGDKFLKAGILNQVSQELKAVVLAAFEKNNEDAETYVPRHTLAKNALWVSWLIVVRKHNSPVAFGSATFITPSLLYLSSAMVLPQEQPTGVGVIANALLWKLAVEEAGTRGIDDVDIICRTHNRSVASVLLHIFENGKLSTESLDADSRAIIHRTASYLGCEYDESTGISYDAYPEGLPAGLNSRSQRINEGFKQVGPKDACYVLGRLDLDYTDRLIARQAKRVVEKVKSKAIQMPLMPELAPMVA